MSQDNWNIVIKPKTSLFDIDFEAIWRYRDLLWIFVKRDIVTVYKQTILGPLWYIIQPILTTITFTFIFGKMANISTEGVPHLVFYLLGITIWGYFSECLTKTSNTFVANQGIFGKVYFPRVIVPGSLVISNLGKFIIQMFVFVVIWSFYYFQGDITPNWAIFLLPLMVMFMGMIAMGFGMLFSSMTTKYRDLQFLLTFGVQLWMYATPVIYPLSTIPVQYQNYIKLNPITSIVETMRYAFLGQGYFSWGLIGYTAIFAFFIMALGALVFNRVEKSFMDTV
jgi:lipopolysaccharide transport system permease protein